MMTSSENEKFQALAACLKNSLSIFQGVIEEFQETEKILETYKEQYLTHKEICNSKKCESSVDLQQVIAAKDATIQSVAVLVTRLIETKDLAILDGIRKILNNNSAISTYPQDSISVEIKKEKVTPAKTAMAQEFAHLDSSIHDNSDFVIEGTPTGRISPIICGRQPKSKQSNNVKEKKQYSSNWCTPESKVIKLSCGTSPKSCKGTPKMKQSRLMVTRAKSVNIVDLTCSPEFSGGVVNQSHDGATSTLQTNIKMEAADMDETILPSPTSGPIKPNFTCLYKSFNRKKKVVSPQKFKQPLPNKISKVNNRTLVIEDVENYVSVCEGDNAEDSINLLQPHSVKKLPLVENMNVINTQKQCDTDVSMSLLPQEADKFTTASTAVKKIKIEMEEKYKPIYKEPTVRKKAEKQALPGWSCEQCEKFYNVLYKDNVEMLRKLMAECSKHRGQHNPARPLTPPGYWNPRWDVAQETEAFNKQNNVT